MRPGYNHNITYKDRIYHVQTEDSGDHHPHVISHLFLGGNIIASVKTAYQEWLSLPDCANKVLQLMQHQHKAMLKSLISGQYDSEISRRSANAGTLQGPTPLNLEAHEQQQTSFGSNQASIPRPDLKAEQNPSPTSTKIPDPDEEVILDAALLEEILSSEQEDSIFTVRITERTFEEVIKAYLQQP